MLLVSCHDRRKNETLVDQGDDLVFNGISIKFEHVHDTNEP